MGYEFHPDLVTPPDETVVWRYLDFVKFVDLLQSKSLWFSRADCFEDPMEAGFTDGEWKWLASRGAVGLVKKSWQNVTKFGRRTNFLNCWRAALDESMAMWDLYGKGSGSVAIKSTIGLLKKVVAPYGRAVFIGEVKYVDWKADTFDSHNILGMCVRKSLSYRHESEVRMVIWAHDLADKVDVPPGLTVPVDLDELITEVVVGPREPKWKGQAVQDVMKRYGFEKKRVEFSELLKPRL